MRRCVRIIMLVLLLMLVIERGTGNVAQVRDNE